MTEARGHLGAHGRLKALLGRDVVLAFVEELVVVVDLHGEGRGRLAFTVVVGHLQALRSRKVSDGGGNVLVGGLDTGMPGQKVRDIGQGDLLFLEAVFVQTSDTNHGVSFPENHDEGRSELLAVILHLINCFVNVADDALEKTKALKKEAFIKQFLPEVFKLMELLEISFEDLKEWRSNEAVK